jgi:hypothetical protein
MLLHNIIILKILHFDAHPVPTVLHILRFVVVMSTQLRSVETLGLKVMQVWDMMFCKAWK